MPLLECVGLVKDFRDKRALDNVEFHVEQGEIVALVGREGAGKTTAYGLVCGLLSPTSGRVLFNGVDVTAWMPDQRERVGIRFVSQAGNVHRNVTVEDALFASPQSLEINVKQQRSQADELIFQFGLNSKRSENVGSLKKALGMAVRRADTRQRYTALRRRLQEASSTIEDLRA